MKRLILATVMLAIAAWSVSYKRIPVEPNYQQVIVKKTAISPFVGQVKFDHMSVRMIVLRHTWDNVSFTDSNEAIQAVNVAASKGLTIKEIGDHNIDKDGTIQRVKYGEPIEFAGLKKFISEQMKMLKLVTHL